MAAVTAGNTADADRLEAQIASIQRDDENRSLPKTALWYARRGWPVFPLRPGDKRPLTDHGLHDATIDQDQIRAWWKAVPLANVGVATGHAFDVIDVDWSTKENHPSGAVWLWPELRDSGLLPDVHGIAMTPRSGLHVFVAPTGDGNLAGKWSGQEFGGIDYRGTGGYIVAPPSRMPVHGAVRHWTWHVRPSPRITNRPDWPDDADPVPQPPVDDTPRIDPDTGRELDVWRASGGRIDQPWAPAHWWQRPRRGQR